MLCGPSDSGNVHSCNNKTPVMIVMINNKNVLNVLSRPDASGAVAHFLCFFPFHPHHLSDFLLGGDWSHPSPPQLHGSSASSLTEDQLRLTLKPFKIHQSHLITQSVNMHKGAAVCLGLRWGLVINTKALSLELPVCTQVNYKGARRPPVEGRIWEEGQQIHLQSVGEGGLREHLLQDPRQAGN